MLFGTGGSFLNILRKVILRSENHTKTNGVLAPFIFPND